MKNEWPKRKYFWKNSPVQRTVHECQGPDNILNHVPQLGKWHTKKKKIKTYSYGYNIFMMNKQSS